MAKVLIVVIVTLLSGCTSSQVMSSGCDFVVGSGKSQQRQVQNSSLANSDTNQEMNVINGVLQMLLGPLSRALGDDECEAQEQLYEYPSVAL